MPIKKTGLFLFALFVYAQLSAQDTTHRQTIEITSSYKPHLRNAVKIDFTATPPNADTSRPRLAYSIPAQNLFFSYQPILLKPLPLAIDTAVMLGTRNYVKAGFGNFTTPYFEGALGFGDPGKGLVKVYGDYISSRGKIKNQDFSEIHASADGSLFTGKHELYGSFGIESREYYQYGYDHALIDYPKADIRRSYRDMSLTTGFRNKDINSTGINYDPHIELHAFTRENVVDESTLMVNLPAEKTIGDHVKVKVALAANINGYKVNSASLKVDNSLLQIAPALEYNSELFNIHAGITPSWNNGESAVLPNLFAEVKLQENIFTIQGGWIGRYIANSFRTLSKQNPYMADPVFLNNTKEMQYFGGIKASIGGHFNFNAKAAFIQYTDMPLFANDLANEKQFLLLNESRLNNFQIHGDMNYINQDKFSVTAGLDLNTYGGLKDNTNAWGLYPLKVNGSIRWNAFKQLLVKGDLIAFSGAKARSISGTHNMKGGTDLSIGAEFKINNMFSAWVDFDNIMNSKYEWWNNYPVYGVQVIGGIIVRF